MGDLTVQLAALSVIAWISHGTSWLPWLLTVGFLLAAVQFYVVSQTGLRGAAKMSTRRKLMLASWAAPSEPNVYGVLHIRADPLKRLIDAAKARGERLTVTTLVAKAAALALRYSPGLNARLVADTFVANATIDVSCLCNVDDGKDLALVSLAAADTKTVKQLTDELTAKATKFRAGKDADFNKTKPLLALLPVAVIRPIVAVTGYLASALALDIPALGVKSRPAGTCMITSVGSMGVQQGFAPFTPFLRCPLLLAVGAIEKKAIVIDGDGDGDAGDRVGVANSLCITATIDHRYADGAEIARLGNHLKRLLEAPELLDSPDATPDLPSAKGKTGAAAAASDAKKD